ncbi:hypothetical protein GXW82_14850 [Streptacidiphilus sp. 4-A2]|nr:hypothetical protein [Streptacidiphilus sp. 4-A2]
MRQELLPATADRCGAGLGRRDQPDPGHRPPARLRAAGCSRPAGTGRADGAPAGERPWEDDDELDPIDAMNPEDLIDLAFGHRPLIAPELRRRRWLHHRHLHRRRGHWRRCGSPSRRPSGSSSRTAS